MRATTIRLTAVAAVALGLTVGALAAPADAATKGTATVQKAFQFGTSSFDSVTGLIGKLSSTSYRVLGTTRGAFPGKTNAGGMDAFVRSTTAAGTVIRQFGTTGDDTIAAEVGTIDAGSTTGSVPGHTKFGGTDGYVWAFDKGHTAWTTQIGTSGQDHVVAIAMGYYGIYALGTTTGTFPGETSKGGTDYFLALLNKTTGAIKDVHQYGTAGDDRVVSMTVEPENLGRCCGNVDHVKIAGDTSGTFPKNTKIGNGGRDLFVHDVIDPFDRKPVTEKIAQFGTSGDDQALAGAGNTIVGSTTGTFAGQKNHGGIDAFVARPALNGTGGRTAWAYEFGTAGSDRATAVEATSEGGDSQAQSYLVAGVTSATLPSKKSHGHDDAFSMRVDEKGLRWRFQSGGSGNDFGEAIASTASGTIVAGTTSATIDGQHSTGLSDDFLMRVNWSRPDVSFVASGSSFYEIGKGRYGGQTGVLLMGSKARTAAIHAYDAGDQSENMRVTGCADTTVFTVRYYVGSRDVTTAVKKGTYTLTSTLSGDARSVITRFTPRAGSKAGQHARCSVRLTSTRTPAVYDDIAVSVGR